MKAAKEGLFQYNTTGWPRTPRNLAREGLLPLKTSPRCLEIVDHKEDQWGVHPSELHLDVDSA